MFYNIIIWYMGHFT